MRTQWFFYDEWDFLKLDSGNLFAPHVEHWSTSPALIYDGLRTVFGLHSYYPFATLVIIAHLAAAHLIWQVARASGANDWVATTTTAIFVVLGSGSENILWAFQIGFVGAMAFGLLAVRLANRRELSRSRFLAILAISLFSLTWSGTSIPLVVATGLVLWRRTGWRRAAIFVAVTASVYLVWFALAAPEIGDTGGLGLYKVFVLMPLFVGVVFFVGFPYTFPIIGVGQVIVVAVAAWAVTALVRRRGVSQLVPAFSLGAAALVFAVLTAYSRATLSVASGASSRYIYTIFLLTLPLMAVALSRLLGNRRKAVGWSSVILIVFAGYTAGVLSVASYTQSAIEQGTRHLISASLSLYLDGEGSIEMDRRPDAQWASRLRMSDLVALYEHGYIDVTGFSPSELEQAKINIGFTPKK